MKTKLILVAVATLGLVSSCSVTQYSHAELMDNEVMNQTKYGILSKYGQPSKVSADTVNSIDVWVYILDAGREASGKTAGLKGKAGKAGFQSSDYGVKYGTSLVSGSSKYMIIVFRKGRVVTWATQGVNLAQKGGGSAMGGKLGIFAAIYVVLMALLLSSLLSMNPY